MQFFGLALALTASTQIIGQKKFKKKQAVEQPFFYC